MIFWVLGYVVCMFIAIVLAHRFEAGFDDADRFLVGVFWPFVGVVLVCAAFSWAAKVVAEKTFARRGP
jgi:hypothetical protein